MPAPETLRWAATQLRRDAQGLVPTLETFLGALGPDVWSGPAADRVRGELELERTALRDAAFELEELANELDRRAAHQEYLTAQRAQEEAAQRAQADADAHGSYSGSVR